MSRKHSGTIKTLNFELIMQSYNRFLERQLSGIYAALKSRTLSQSRSEITNNSVAASPPRPSRMSKPAWGVEWGKGSGVHSATAADSHTHSAQHDHSRRANNYAKIRAKPSKKAKKARPRARRLRPLPCSLTTSPEARTVFTFRTLRPHQPTYFSNHVKSRTVPVQYR